MPFPRLLLAVIGDEITLSGSHESNFLTRIERSLDGVEIYNFGLPRSGPRPVGF